MAMAYGQPDYGAYKVVVRRVDLAIPANTSSGDPESTTVELDKGELRGVEVGFPPGCVGLVGVRVRDGSEYVLPSAAGEWLAWNDILLRFAMQYGVMADETVFTIEGYSEDDSFSHTVVLHLIEYVAR